MPENGDNFNFTDDYVKMMQPSYLSIPNIDTSNGAWTMAYTIRLHNVSTDQPLLLNGDENSGSFISRVTSNGSVQTVLFTESGSILEVSTNSSVIEAETWTELKFVWNSSSITLKIFVDGVEEGSGSIQGQDGNIRLRNSTGRLTWGKDVDSGSGLLNADMKDFYFYRAVYSLDICASVSSQCGNYQTCVATGVRSYYCACNSTSVLYNGSCVQNCEVNYFRYDGECVKDVTGMKFIV